MLGLTFKENCPAVRNSKVPEVIRELVSFGCRVHMHDPVAAPREAQPEHGLTLTDWNGLPTAQAMVAAVVHQIYRTQSADELVAMICAGGLFIDVKSAYDPTGFFANNVELVASLKSDQDLLRLDDAYAAALSPKQARVLLQKAAANLKAARECLGQNPSSSLRPPSSRAPGERSE